MKKYLRELVLLVFVIIPFIYLAFIWGSLPERVPTHFGNDDADGWSNKMDLLYITIGVVAGTYVLFLILPIGVPKEKMALWSNKYYVVRFVISLFFSTLMILCLYLSFTYKN